MGRILKTDKRYNILAKIPKVREGRVVFRKKPGKAKYVIALLELDGNVHSVLYRISTVYDDGVPITAMSFRDFKRT
jgi:hypothetical protein